MKIKKGLLIVGGGLVTFVGALVFISPIPFGFAIILPGAAMLILGSDAFATWIENRRRENDQLDKKLSEAQRKAPDQIVAPLEKTDPNHSG